MRSTPPLAARSQDGRRLADVAREAALTAERAVISDTLRQVHWNRRKAAQILGVSYKTLLNKIKETGIETAVVRPSRAARCKAALPSAAFVFQTGSRLQSYHRATTTSDEKWFSVFTTPASPRDARLSLLVPTFFRCGISIAQLQRIAAGRM